MSMPVESDIVRPVPGASASPVSLSKEQGGTPLCSAQFLRWFLVPATLLMAGAAAFYVDMPLAKFCYAREYPGFVRHILDNAEPFGDAYGLLLIVCGLFLLNPAGRFAVPWLIASGLCSGLAADVVKLLVSRTRPQSFNLNITNVAATFNGWLPEMGAKSEFQSFPSAHTAVGVGFAIALCQFYPRGRVLFIAMAVMCGMHRVQSCAHFLSDAFIGAAVGWLISHLILHSKWCPAGPAPLGLSTTEHATT
ncbi:PAP2 superfamily protein [Symmachiella dynata]|nr:PAP2 superfamily protein [Symmachiella dynata]